MDSERSQVETSDTNVRIARQHHCQVCLCNTTEQSLLMRMCHSQELLYANVISCTTLNIVKTKWMKSDRQEVNGSYE